MGLGRSRVREAAAHLPSSDDNIAILKANFRSKGLNSTDLAILSGNSHCFSFEKRLHHHYNNGRSGSDATLDSSYKAELLRRCRAGNNTVVEMVPGSSTTFGTKYYGLVSERRGLFHSDEALLVDELTRGYVYSGARLPEFVFFSDFEVSMVKMGRAGVLTGSSGEIRNNYPFVNN